MKRMLQCRRGGGGVRGPRLRRCGSCTGARPLLASSWRRPSRPDPPRSSSKRTCAPPPRSPPHRPHAGCWRRGGAQRGARGVHTGGDPSMNEPVTHGPDMLLSPLGPEYRSRDTEPGRASYTNTWGAAGDSWGRSRYARGLPGLALRLPRRELPGLVPVGEGPSSEQPSPSRIYGRARPAGI